MKAMHIPPQAQRGASLIVGLIFLVAVTLLGVIAMKNTILQERMAGGMRDRSLALQAAEAALRDAKLDLLNMRVAGVVCAPADGCHPQNPIDLQSGFDGACTLGRCYSTNGLYGGQRAWEAFPLDQGPSVVYGTFTGAQVASLGNVAAPPRYLIEVFLAEIQPGKQTAFYRITARAVGANLNTVVVLQEVFAP